MTALERMCLNVSGPGKRDLIGNIFVQYISITFHSCQGFCIH